MAGPIKYTDLFDPSLGPGAAELADFTKAVAGLQRQYRTFAKNIDEDKARVQAGLAAVQAQAGLIEAQATKLSALNEQERAGFARLQAQVNSLIAEQKRLTEVQAAQAKAQTVVKDATQQAQSALRAMQNELREAYAAKDTTRIEKAAVSIRTYKTETQGLTLALRGTNSEFTAARGSYDALDAENKKLIASLRALGGGMSGSSAEAAKLEKQIADNTQQLKDYDARILVFNRNVGNYASGFAGLVQELAKARAAQAGLATGSEEYNRQQIKVNGFQTAAQRAAAQMGLSYEQAEAKINGATAAITPLVTNLRRLETEQEEVAVSAGKESEAFRVLGFQIEKTKKEINDVAVATTQVDQKQASFTQQLGFSKEGVQQFAVGLAASTLGLQAALNAIESVFQANVAYSRNLAEVRKTTGLTADEADRLGASLKALDTPTSLAGLLKIASVGGQLGVAKGDLLEFTKAIDTAVQALGNDFTGGAEEIATVLGKLTTVYRKELGPDVAQNILAIGSAVNQLGADGAATAPFLTDVALRTGQASAQFNLGLKNALAYAAVLEETGTTAEVAGTALNRLYSTLGNKTKEAYAIAQRANPALTLKEFTHLVNTDFNQAIQLFLKGLNAGNASTTEVNARLATLKLQSGEAKNAILALSQNTDLFAQRQASANEQLRESTSLAAEAAVNNDTLGGSVDKLKNSVSNFFTSGAAGKFLKFLVDVVAFDLKLGAAPFRALGDGIGYLAQKAGLVEAPLKDVTAAQVASVTASLKQQAAQQKLLDSYTALEKVTSRSGTQELEFARLRGELQKQFGTDEAKAIAQRIEDRKQDTEANIAEFKRNLDNYTQYVDEVSKRAAALQQAVNTAPRNAAGELSTLAGQQAAEKLRVTEKELAEAQRVRALYAAAVAKFQTAANKATEEGTQVGKEAEQQLDRAAVERAKNRIADLRAELEANQRRIDEARKYQAEQGKLFADKQITSKVFADEVAGSEDLISGYERDGAALRIKIARAEGAEKLVEAENDRVRQRKKKDVTQAELTDIDRQYALRRERFAKETQAAIAKIEDETAAKLRVAPLEFKVPTLDANTLKPVTEGIDKYAENQEKAFQRALTAIAGNARAEMAEATRARAAGEIGESKYQDRLFAIRKEANARVLALTKQYHKEAGEADAQAADDELETAQRLAEKRKDIAQKAGNTLITIDGYYTQFKQNALDTQIQNVQAAYDKEVEVAGNNTVLKAQIDKKYQKQLAKLNYEKAKTERDQAAFTILINTAVAVAKAVAESPATFGLPFSLFALANGAIQEALVYSKPLPAYFKGRKSGPAEMAHLAERGPELAGQPSTGYRLYDKPTIGRLAAGDEVLTASETQRILAQNDLVEGRIVQRAHQADLETQTTKLRVLSTGNPYAAEAAQARAAQARDTDRIVRAIQEQEYYRLNEQDDVVRRVEADGKRREKLERRYKRRG